MVSQDVSGHPSSATDVDALDAIVVERRLLERLVAAGDSLAAADDVQSIADILVEQLVQAFGAPIAGLFLREGDILRARSIGGASSPVREAWAEFPATGTEFPVSEAIARGEAVYLSSLEELVARYPAVDTLSARTGLTGAAVFVPLVAGGRSLGVMVLRFAERRAFSEGEQGFLRSFAHQAGLAITRVGSLHIAEAATTEARLTAQRADLLARASETLSRILDDRSALAALADLTVPAIADWCFVRIVDEAGDVSARAARYADPARASLVDAIRRNASGPDAGAGASDVLGLEAPVLIEAISDEHIRQAARDPDHEAALRALGARSTIIVALVSHGRAFGSMTLLTAESGRTYTSDDLALVEEIARRAGLAIENARLYDDLRRSREQAESLARASDVLAQSLDRDTLLRRLAELAVAGFADRCFVNVADAGGTLRCVAAAARVPGDLAQVERWIGQEIADPAFTERRSIVWAVRRNGRNGADAGDAPIPLPYLLELAPRSAIAVPVRGRSGVVGSLTLIGDHERPGYSAADIDHAEQLAWRTALAIENAALYAELREHAVVEQARASELDAVIQSVGDPLVLCDRDGRVRLTNQAAMRVFGGEVPPTYGTIRERFDDPVMLPPRIEPRRVGPAELRLRGTDRWLEVTMYPVPLPLGAKGDGAASSVDSSILVLRDVTEQRRVLELREAFIGVLSHELRTPITTIYGGTRVLAREGLAEDTRREIAADVTAEAERLHRLAEDLLVLARAERGTIEIGGDPVLLQHLVARVLRVEEARWPDTQVTLRVPAPVPAVTGDETYVEQVVRNLVGNAAKYGGLDRTVEVLIERLEDEVSVRVLDEGPAFDADEADRLFDLFFRGSNASSTTTGAGIGLFVCRALIEAMGGRIWGRPRPAGGAEFGFALPIFTDES
jgi:signal transduction histidine kinase